MLVVRHLNKASGGNPIYRGGGSIGIVGAARAGLLVAADPDDPTRNRYILAGTKANLAALAPASGHPDKEAALQGSARVIWDGQTEHTASGLLAAGADPSRAEKLQEACDFPGTSLADGPQPAGEVQTHADKLGIKRGTLNRAERAAGHRSGEGGPQERALDVGLAGQSGPSERRYPSSQ